MGFNTSTTVLTAKLTPLGRQRLISSNNNLITKFSLGDSDANYNATLNLSSGEVPGYGGDLTASSGVTNNGIAQNTGIKSNLFLLGSNPYKNVEANSSRLIVSNETIGTTTVTGTSLSHDTIYLSAGTTDSLVNLYNSFNLPISNSEKSRFTGTTFNRGGWADTALSGFAADRILVIGIPNTQYGDLLDGKAIRLTVSGTTGGTYTLYSTFQRKTTSASADDNQYTETSTQTTYFNPNYAFVFSDQIKRPNGDASKSWATGYGTTKPFSANRKERYNLTTNSALGYTADTAVGIAFLDKGFIVITDPTIVDDFNVSNASASTCTFDSVATVVNQEIICIAGKGEFGSSNNRTFTKGDVPRVSEIGLYDLANNLIAYGKTNQHITKTVNELKVLAVRISI